MTAENFSPFSLSKEKIDIAFIPYWFLMPPKAAHPKTIIAVHIPPVETEAVTTQLKKDLPEAIAFTKNS
jgi:hypothetical protein